MNSRRLLLALLTALALWATSPHSSAQTAADPGMGVRISRDDTVMPPTYRFSWWGRSGRHYLVLRTEDLMGPWTPMPGLNPSGTDDVLTYVEIVPESDPNDPEAAPKVFFRVVEFDPISPPLTGNSLPDRWEQFYFGITEVDPAADADGDGLSNLQEYQRGIDPTHGDTDGDGMPDHWEVMHNLNPKSIAGVSEDAGLDPDHDGLNNLQEFGANSNPFNRDSDDDGLDDGFESELGTDPAHAEVALDLYYVAEFLPMPAGTTDASAVGISNTGIVVGWAAGATKDYAARWIGGGVEIGLANTNDSYLQAVNDDGIAVGEGVYDVNHSKALIWPVNSAPSIFGGTFRSTFAWDINKTGLIVGTDSFTGAFTRNASGSYGSLTAPSGYRYPSAFAVNDNGLIVGAAQNTASGEWRAIRWTGGSASPLTFGTARATDVNNRDEVVGLTEFGGFDARTFLHRNGVVTILPEPAGGTVSHYGAQINLAGMILGHSSEGPLIWQRGNGGEMPPPSYLADRLLTPLERVNFSAYGLNDRCELAGDYYDASSSAFLPVRFKPVLLPRLLVDLDRDGTLRADATDQTNTENPFRFWINDDDDYGDDKRSSSDDVPLPEGSGARDSASTLVDGIRDLEDFFPVFLDIKSLLNAFPITTGGISYRLRQDDSAVGIVFTNLSRSQALDYLRGAVAGLETGFGPALTQKAGEATVTKITATGVDISSSGAPDASPAFFQRIRDNGGGVLLVEASKPTDKPLVLEVWRDSALVVELRLELKIGPVETMFRYHNLRSLAHGTAIESNNQGPGFGNGTSTDAPNDPFAAATDRKNLVFVHGYNVNADAARGSAVTVFKRFYWSGSKAKFHALLWRGDDGQGEGFAPAGATPDYHRNVGHAWQQGMHFRDFLETLPGDTAIMAHSLGNLVAKVALTRSRDSANPARVVFASKPPGVKHFFAVDAAVPLEATFAGEITSESKERMRHEDWDEYDIQERLWPTHWHKLFAGSGDARAGLTWQGAFASLEIGTNFYSSGEDVLANPINDGTPLWEPLFFGGQRAWVAQEKMKGGNGLAAPFFRSWTAGWTENTAWYVPIVPTPPLGSPQTRRRFASEALDASAPDGVPTSALASEPFFQRFQSGEDGVFYPGYQGSQLHAPLGDTNAHDEASKLATIAKCLGEAIPALSYAQGSNPAVAFSQIGMGGNSDLNTSEHKNGWPTSRGSDTNWKHSDCLNVCYIHHFKFYDRMTTNGGLK